MKIFPWQFIFLLSHTNRAQVLVGPVNAVFAKDQIRIEEIRVSFIVNILDMFFVMHFQALSLIKFKNRKRFYNFIFSNDLFSIINLIIRMCTLTTPSMVPKRHDDNKRSWSSKISINRCSVRLNEFITNFMFYSDLDSHIQGWTMSCT